MSAAATAVANGRYDIRVSALQLGADFANLSEAFNQMAQRLESVDTTRRQLLGDLAHEIRTPVSILEAYMEAVEDGVEALDPDIIAMLRDQTPRLVRFSDDFAALAQAEEGRTAINPQWIDPIALIGRTTGAAGGSYTTKHVALSTDVATLPMIWADPHRLGQVLANLLDNALRHTPPGGEVHIAATTDSVNVTIAIADNGEGIAAEQLPHLFERFYRADTARNRDRGGAGIGLAIAKALTEAHGGRVSAASRGPGMASTFTVVVPIGPPIDQLNSIPHKALSDPSSS